MESSLISEFTNTCGHGLEASNIAFSESCSVEGESFEKLTDVHSVQVNNGVISIPLINEASEKEKKVTFFRFYCSGCSPQLLQLVCVYILMLLPCVLDVLILFIRLVLQNYLLSRITKQSKGQPKLIVLCNQGHRTLGGAEEQTSEGMILMENVFYTYFGHI